MWRIGSKTSPQVIEPQLHFCNLVDIVPLKDILGTKNWTIGDVLWHIHITIKDIIQVYDL